MIESKTLAILMATHTRLGNESTLPKDIVVMIARVFHDEARREEMEAKLARAIAENQLLIEYPHSVETVAAVLVGRTTREEQRYAVDLARTVFMRVYPDQEPVNCDIGGEKMDRYKDDDLWILNEAVQRMAFAYSLPLDGC